MDECKLVGERIRHFRKMRKLTLVEFAKLINKGKSVVSKYERGEVAIDIITIKQISKILGVPVYALLDDNFDYHSPFFEEDIPVDSMEEGSNVSTAYIYTYSSHEGKAILRAYLLKNIDDKAMLYTYPTTEIKHENFDCLYSGQIVRDSSFTRLLLSNCYAQNDLMIFDFPVQFNTHQPVVGFFTSISIPPYSPIATAAILTNTQITDDEWLISKLSFGKEQFRKMKKINGFMVPLTSNFNLLLDD